MTNLAKVFHYCYINYLIHYNLLNHTL